MNSQDKGNENQFSMLQCSVSSPYALHYLFPSFFNATYWCPWFFTALCISKGMWPGVDNYFPGAVMLWLLRSSLYCIGAGTEVEKDMGSDRDSSYSE